MSEIIHETQIVYKKTSTGKIQQWRAWVETTDTGFLLKVESGQTDGKLTVTPGQVIDEGKQKRSSREQAIFEATSKLSKKRDEAYFDTIEEAQTQVKLLPMLAHPFTKRKHNIDYPAIVQRKFDGVRCLARLNSDGTVTLMSRKGKEFPHLDHLRSEINLNNDDSNLVIDGELYSDTLTFQELVGLVRRVTLKEGNEEQMLEVSLRVYDCINLNNEQDFSDRYETITKICDGAKYLSLVENVTVNNESEIHAAQARFVCMVQAYQTAARWKAGRSTFRLGWSLRSFLQRTGTRPACSSRCSGRPASRWRWQAAAISSARSATCP